MLNVICILLVKLSCELYLLSLIYILYEGVELKLVELKFPEKI